MPSLAGFCSMPASELRPQSYSDNCTKLSKAGRNFGSRSMDALHEGRNSGARLPNLISVIKLLLLAFFVGCADASFLSLEDGGDEGPARWEASDKI